MLTELALILCSVMVCLTFATVVARVSLRSAAGTADLRRLAEAADRATDAFLWRANKVAGLGIMLTSGLVLAGHGLYSATVSARGWGGAAWTIFGLLAGGVGTGIVARVAASVVLRAATRAAADGPTRAESVVSIGVRAGGVLGLSADAASTAIVAGAFALPYFLAGATVTSQAELAALVATATNVLPGVAVGAACAGLVYQQAGSAHLASSNIGAAVGAEVHAGLSRDDARNPALVAGLVGQQVGLAAGRAVDAFVLGTLGNVAAWMVGVATFAQAGGTVWGLVTLPLLARSIGAFSSIFGLLTARADAGESPALSLWRGQVVASLVALGGVAGASLWLFGARWPYLTGAAAAGLLGLGAVAHSIRWLGQGSAGLAKELAESTRNGVAVMLARALAQGMVGVWLPILGVGVAATIAWQLGTMTQLRGGGALGLSTSLAAALGVAVYALALGALRPVSRAALGLRAVKRRAQGSDERRETEQLQGVVLEVGTVARTYFATLGPAATLFAILALPTRAESVTDGLTPAILCAGFLGAATVLVFTGHTLAVAARAARSAAAEVERQLKGFPKGPSGIAIPDEFTPTYRILVDQASKAGLSRLLPPIGVAVGAPLALGIALRLLYSSGRPAIQGLTAFIVIAAVTGLATALTVDATRAVLGAAHRSNLPRGTHPGFQISAEGEALADLVGTTAGPASLLLTKTLATAVLVIAPLLS